MLRRNPLWHAVTIHGRDKTDLFEQQLNGLVGTIGRDEIDDGTRQHDEYDERAVDIGTRPERQYCRDDQDDDERILEFRQEERQSARLALAGDRIGSELLRTKNGLAGRESVFHRFFAVAIHIPKNQASPKS